MNTDHLNIEPNRVLDTPDIIYLKDYPIIRSTTITPTIQRKSINQMFKDERVSLSPFYLEDTISIRSNQSSPSGPDGLAIYQNPDQRSIEFEDISENDREIKNRVIDKATYLVSRKSVQVIGVITLCVSSFLSITLIPYHNVILFPSYWYEAIAILELGGRPGYFGLLLVHGKMILEYQEVMKPSLIVTTYVVIFLLGVVIKTCEHLLWTLGMGYNSPIPFSLAIDSFFAWFVCLMIGRYILSKSIRFSEDPAFRKRVKAYVIYTFWCGNVPGIISSVFETFKELNNEYCSMIGFDVLWMIAIILLFMKKISNSVMVKYLTKVAKPEKVGLARGMVTIENGAMFKSFVLVLIGSKTDAVTGYCFLGISVLLNMKFCLDIMKVHKQIVVDVDHIEASHERKKSLITTLMLNETVDFFTTIAYASAISIAYHGPNAGIIGNIKNDYWQYHAIDSLPNVLTGLSYSMLIDVSCGAITLLTLWICCGINGLRFFKDNIGQYAHSIIFCITREINMVSIFKYW